MCGRYELTKPVVDEFDFVEWPEIQPSLEIKPSNPAPVILSVGHDHHEVQFRRWGFVRFWTGKTGKPTKKLLINAKSEAITITKNFKKAFAEHRCIIPLNAWFEWPEDPQINDGIKTKVRLYMPDRPTFGAAGIYEDKIDQETGEVTRYFSMVTVDPEQYTNINFIHDRSPMVLRASDYETWLQGSANQAESLLHPYPDPDAFAFEIPSDGAQPSSDSSNLDLFNS